MKKETHRLEKTALAITRWVGSPASIIAHTLAFVGSFLLAWLHVLPFDRMLLILTTVVSLEAIYLAIFIQMTINTHSEALEEVEQDIDEIQEDIDEIQEDVDEIQEDVDEIQEDVDEIQEDVEEMSEEEKKEAAREEKEHRTIEDIHAGLRQLLEDIEKMKK